MIRMVSKSALPSQEEVYGKAKAGAEDQDCRPLARVMTTHRIIDQGTCASELPYVSLAHGNRSAKTVRDLVELSTSIGVLRFSEGRTVFREIW